ncbi:MAG: hypothetical protein GX442_18145 [Candidatus Riflebacteria bacterium]|nr:hypothetical protein [Candidatus Riflebacteria bacterium]
MVRTPGMLVLGLVLLVAAVPLLARDDWREPGCIPAGHVSLEVVGDERGTLPLWWPDRGGRWDDHYLQGTVEARQGERYRLRVANRTGGRIGLVIAVDGRNIISGERSFLRPSESMYVLNPHRSGTFSGWRSGLHSENRFYFTTARDSYSGAWGDTSRLGTIEVAVFQERYRSRRYEPPMYDQDAAKAAAPSAAGESNLECRPARDAGPGTGYGEEIHSRVYETEFDPEAFPSERQVIRYVWPGALRVDPEPPLRYTPEDDSSGFAPPPPRRY